MRPTILAMALAAAPSFARLGSHPQDSALITERAASGVVAILQGQSALADGATYGPPGAIGSPACEKDKCCLWHYISLEMVEWFKDGNRCGSLARQAIRLMFHDSGAWNTTMDFGGADGSAVLTEEADRRENSGLKEISARLRTLHNKYRGKGVSMADLIQVGSNVATVVCPRGPRIRTFVGRLDSTKPAPEGLLPGPRQEASQIRTAFAAKGISPDELVALIGSHTVSRQSAVDPAQRGAPQDPTPGTWDTAFYRETAARNPSRGVVRFPSDVALAHDSVTAAKWAEFSAPGAQTAWNAAYAQAAFKMSMFGVKNLNDLVECSAILPLPRNAGYSKFKI